MCVPNVDEVISEFYVNISLRFIIHKVGCEIDTMKDIVTEVIVNKLRLCAIELYFSSIYLSESGKGAVHVKDRRVQFIIKYVEFDLHLGFDETESV